MLFACAAARTAAAPPNIVTDLTVIENRPPDDIFGLPGLYLTLRVDVTHADGWGALIGPPANATAEANNNNYPFTNPTPLPFLVVGATGNYFIQLIPITTGDFPNISGRYQYLVTDNDGQDDQFLGHNLNRMEVIPRPANLAVTNNTTTPTFSFTDPDPTPNISGLTRWYHLWILDANLNGVALLPPGGTNTTTINVPPGTLCPCNQYYFRADSFDIDDADQAAENLANAFLTFTASAVPHSGDISHDCLLNAHDIAPFVAALIGGATGLPDTCAADFSNNQMVDYADIPGFVNKLLGL